MLCRYACYAVMPRHFESSFFLAFVFRNTPTIEATVCCHLSGKVSRSLCVRHLVSTRFGQVLDGFPRFVQRSGDCPYNFEKNPINFLETAGNQFNFASSKRNKRHS